MQIITSLSGILHSTAFKVFKLQYYSFGQKRPRRWVIGQTSSENSDIPGRTEPEHPDKSGSLDSGL